MKWIFAVAAVFTVLGAWAGFRADGAASVAARFQTGLVVFFACHLLLCTAQSRGPATD